MSKISHLILFLILLPMVASTQPYWWQPATFYPEVGKPCVISWVDGLNFTGKPLLFNREQFSSIDQVDITGQKSVLSFWKNGDQNQLTITPEASGNHLLIAQTVPVHSELTAEDFNAFLKEYGQDEIYFNREATGKLHTPGKQTYTQHVKLLLQVGNQFDVTFKKTLGLPLEIIPEKNPYELKPGEMMRFKILYNGKPLFGARVKVWNRKDNRTTLQNIYTEKDGTMETRISTTGPWMISVVHVTTLSTNVAEYRSYWSGLVFGLK